MTQSSEEQYLSRLGRALAPLSEAEAADILSELRSHFQDRREAGGDEQVQQTIDAFGNPEDYARQYIELADLRQAVASGRAGDLFRVLLTQAPKRIAAFCGFVLVAFFYLLSAGFFMIAVAELVVPAMNGLWVGGDAHPFVLGVLVSEEARSTADELLGWMILPLGAVLGAVTMIIGLTVSRWSAALMLSRNR